MRLQTRSTRAPLAMSVLAGMAFLGACGSQDSQRPPDNPGTVTLLPGQSATITRATTLSLPGGSTGTEDVLVLVDTATSGSAHTSYSVTGTDIGAAGSVTPPSTARISASLSPSASSVVAEPTLDISFGARLNERGRPRLTRGFRAARSAYIARNSSRLAPSRSVSGAAPQVGDIVTVNVGSDFCDTIVLHPARVVAIGAQSIVLSDTLNPAGGFSTADFQRFAARFDTLVYPLDVANFGAPADIDQNHKIILLFTEAVNELTPRNSSSYVGGFFFSRDLFPIQDAPDFTGCKGSNVGELFYLLAPDPTGSINGNVRRTGFVDSVTTSVLAHEFQHLINASRRLYINKNASEFEATYLNEGLSHIAEELLFLHEANLPPRRNIDVTLIRSNPAIRSAFNADQSANTGRYQDYLTKPSESSPIRADDSLETRGATWNFLRYAADRKAGSGSSDVATWQALVNSSDTGIVNLRAVFTPDIGGWLRDWSVSQYTDDLVPGVQSQFTQPSWNFHDIFPALSGSGNTYPLQVHSLTAAPASGTLIPGSAAFYRFAIKSGTTATMTVTAPGPVQALVVRVR